MDADAMQRAVARRCLSGFLRYTLPGWRMGWVHEVICRELDIFVEAVRLGRSPRLLLTMPPRHGKSELASRRFPAYVLGRYPEMELIAASYTAELAGRMSRDVQRIMESGAYRRLFPGTVLPGRSESQSRTGDFFSIRGAGGSYRAAGVGGSITGMGGDIVIVDDPLKDRADADSPAIRTKLWDWYTSTLYTRLSPGGGLVLMQTRWHTDDLAGRLIQASGNGGDTWQVLNFPALAVTDERWRKQGEALHPERYDVRRLKAIRRAIGTRDWEALYQQSPVVDGGALFRRDWLRFWQPAALPEHFDRLLLSWDMNFKEGSGLDFVVGQAWGRAGAAYYLLDQVRGQWSFTRTLAEFTAFAGKWPDATEKLVEDKANGPAVIDSVRHTVPGVIAVEPQGGKIARAHTVTPLFEAGNVYLPDPAAVPWAEDLLSELLQFPGAAHDDQVDAMNQALQRFLGKPSLHFKQANVRRRRRW